MVRILIVILVDVYDKYIGIKLGRLAGTAIACLLYTSLQKIKLNYPADIL